MSSDQTIAEAKALLRANFEKGIKCPCCNQFVKRYKRKITGSMAASLILMKKENDKRPGEWVHLDKLLVRLRVPASKESAILRYWKLIENQKGKREDGSARVGFFRITQRGIDFVKAKIKVEKYAHCYNQSVLAFSDATVSISEALGSKFNYSELMGLPNE